MPASCPTSFAAKDDPNFIQMLHAIPVFQLLITMCCSLGDKPCKDEHIPAQHRHLRIPDVLRNNEEPGDPPAARVQRPPHPPRPPVRARELCDDHVALNHDADEAEEQVRVPARIPRLRTLFPPPTPAPARLPVLRLAHDEDAHHLLKARWFLPPIRERVPE